MKKELESALSWLEHRHETMKLVAEHDKETYQSSFMQGYASGLEAAVHYYGEEIAKVRQILEGYLINDVDLSGGEDETLGFQFKTL